MDEKVLGMIRRIGNQLPFILFVLVALMFIGYAYQTGILSKGIGERADNAIISDNRDKLLIVDEN